MSKTGMFAAVIVMALGVTACGEKTSSGNVSETATSAGQAARDATRATGTAIGDAAKATGNAIVDAASATGTAVGDAAKATGEYLAPSKDAAVAAAQETLDGIEEKWQTLQAKAAPITEEAKADYRLARDRMAQTLADAKAKLVEAKDAGVDAWQKNVKPALDAVLQKAQTLYEDASAKFGSM